MFGVVLWSDNNLNQAVIWCEDHGDLAFFKAGRECGSGPEDMQAGDLVSFELVAGNPLRLARDPTLVVTEKYPTLASDLKAVMKGHRAEEKPAASGPSTSGIVPFEMSPAAEEEATGISESQAS